MAIRFSTRLFRFIDTSFVPEAYEAIANSKINTLPELNQALVAWVDGYYHQRKHGGTGQTPLARVDKSQRQPLRKTMAELTEIFLWEETRKVDKTGCVRLSGNIYEVDVELSGQKVLLICMNNLFETKNRSLENSTFANSGLTP